MKIKNADYGLILLILFVILILFDLSMNLYTNSNLVISNIFSDLNATNGWEQRGQWGDILSGHFSALAFLAVAYTIYIQQKDSKIQKSLNSFKMILELSKNVKEESMLLTSKSSEPLTNIMTKTHTFIKEKNTTELVNMYKNTFHDIILIESFIETFLILKEDLFQNQIDTILLKSRYIESEYKLITIIYFWSDVSIRCLMDDYNFENIQKEESKTIKKISTITVDALTEIKNDFESNWINFFNDTNTLKKYNDRIGEVLFDYSTKKL